MTTRGYKVSFSFAVNSNTEYSSPPLASFTCWGETVPEGDPAAWLAERFNEELARQMPLLENRMAEEAGKQPAAAAKGEPSF